MRVVSRFGSRICSAYHFALRNLTLSEDGRRVIAVDPGSAATRQLCRSKRGERDELKRSHVARRADHRAPAARPKKSAAKMPMTTAPSSAIRTLRLNLRSC